MMPKKNMQKSHQQQLFQALPSVAPPFLAAAVRSCCTSDLSCWDGSQAPCRGHITSQRRFSPLCSPHAGQSQGPEGNSMDGAWSTQLGLTCLNFDLETSISSMIISRKILKSHIFWGICSLALVQGDYMLRHALATHPTLVSGFSLLHIESS